MIGVVSYTSTKRDLIKSLNQTAVSKIEVVEVINQTQINSSMATVKKMISGKQRSTVIIITK